MSRLWLGIYELSIFLQRKYHYHCEMEIEREREEGERKPSVESESNQATELSEVQFPSLISDFSLMTNH